MSKAQTLPNEALKAVRSATSASPRSWTTGWWPPTSVEPSPCHMRSASSSRSAIPSGWHNRRHGVHGLRQRSDAVLRRSGREQLARVVAGQQAALRGRDPPADGAAPRGAEPGVGRGQAVPSQPRHPLLEGQGAVQDEHRGGHPRRPRRFGVPVAVVRRAARRRRGLPPRPPAAGPVPCRGGRGRARVASSRASPPTCERRRQTSPRTRRSRPRPAATPPTIPASTCSDATASSASGATRPASGCRPRPSAPASRTGGGTSVRSTTGWSQTSDPDGGRRSQRRRAPHSIASSKVPVTAGADMHALRPSEARAPRSRTPRSRPRGRCRGRGRRGVGGPRPSAELGEPTSSGRATPRCPTRRGRAR